MHELNLSEIEATAAGSREKWWFKPPMPGDEDRIKTFVLLLSEDELAKYYDMFKNKSYATVNNRFYLFLCKVAEHYETRTYALKED